MPKQLKELRRFQAGTKSAAADTDVQEESAIYSKNIDPISEEGKLKGVKEHIKVLPNEELIIFKLTHPDVISGGSGSWFDYADESTYAYRDATGNSLLGGWPYTITFNHGGLGTTPITHTINWSPVDNSGIANITDAQIYKMQNDQHYVDIKTYLDALSAPSLTVQLARGEKGTEYPYPLDNVTEFNVDNDREEFITSHTSTHDADNGASYSSGDPVPLRLLPPYRSLELLFDAKYTNNGTEFEVKHMNVSLKTHGSYGTFTEDETRPNTLNENIGGSTGPYKVVEDVTSYLEVNATEMELFNSENKDNIAFYSVTENDVTFPGYDPETDTGAGTTYRMKVLSDIYGEKEILANTTINDETVHFDIPNEPEDVSLTKNNAHIYIGCGNTEGAKTKWFGKLDHKQFDESVGDYRLEDAEVYPIDDGQTVFNLSWLSYNRHGSTLGEAIDSLKVYGIADGMMDLFAIDTSSNSTSNTDLGVQVQSTTKLPFTPTVITPSKYQWANNYNRTTESDWTAADNTTIYSSHTHDANTTYWWASNKYKEGIQLFYSKFDTSANTLDVTTGLSGSAIQFNFTRPPGAGTKVQDIIETYDGSTYRVWVLFTKKDFGPFTWDEEFVYSFDVSDINWSGNSVTLHEHTPPALKMKKCNAWNLGANSGYSVYCDEVSQNINFGSLPYVCTEGAGYSARQNKLKYRGVDELGDPGDNDWSSLNGRHWHRNGIANWDMGYDGGFDKSVDYEINPHPKGLIDLGHGHRIGMLAHLKGKYVTDMGEMDTARRSKWPKRWYYAYPVRNSSTIDLDETMLFFIDPEHKGVRHRRVSRGLDPSTGYATSWDSDSDTYAIRQSNYKLDNSSDKVNMMARRFASATIATGYPGWNDINRLPDNIANIISTNKIMAQSSTTNFWFSVKGEKTNSTVLQRYTYSYPDRTGTEPIDSTIPVGPVNGTDFVPMIFEDLGSSTFAHDYASGNERFFLSPRMGQYINAEANYNPSTGWIAPTDLSSNEGSDLYPDTYAHYHEHSELPYGIALQDGDATDVVDGSAEPGNFNAGTNYYYKMSVLYDGFQESPLTTFYFVYSPTANCNTVIMTVKLESPPPRATHVMIYRKNNVEDFYRMVSELDLSTGWGKSGDMFFKVEVDDGNLSGTYESITGMPESMRGTGINYKLSTTAGGYLIAGNCFHPEIKNGQNFIYRSQPGNYSIFNWARDYLILPNEPTALAYFAGRLFAFDRSNMYKIDVNSLIIEDEHKGVGCFGEQSYIITDFGFFFCDANNMYMHNGSQVQAIGTDILKNAKFDETNTIKSNWHNINHAYDPYVAYDAFNQTVMFMWEDTNGDKGSWNYNIPRNRWDLIDIPRPLSFAQGKFGERFLSDGTYLYQLNEDSSRSKFTHYTPSIDFGFATVDKKIKKIKFIMNNTTDVANAEYHLKVYSDDVLLYECNHDDSSHTSSAKKFKDEEHEREYRMPKNKTKKLRLEIINSNVEIDSIAITYIQRKVD